MAKEKVLIVGAGVAGSVLAFWLGKHDFDVTVLERSKASQKAGQGIEIEDEALKVVKAMGIMPQLEAKRTGEAGFELVDEKSRSYGVLGDVGGFSPTGALEMMRGDLTEILYKAADEMENVRYLFQMTVVSLRDVGKKVIVAMESRESGKLREEEFDLVVGADGVKSRTRQMVMGPDEKLDCLKPVGAFSAYFSIPMQDHDWPYSKLCHFPGRKLIWLRPVAKDSKTTSAYIIHLSDNAPRLHQANASGDRQKQKEALAEMFTGLGWETSRVIKGLMAADNFYSDELAQVKLKTWSQGRVALIGDAAWAPTPFTGQGNQLAIVGAWVLAQELSRNRNTIAFEKYEQRLRKHVESAQAIGGWGYAPYIFVPETAFGIWLFRTIYLVVSKIVQFISRTNVASWFPAGEQKDIFDLEMHDIYSTT